MYQVTIIHSELAGVAEVFFDTWDEGWDFIVRHHSLLTPENQDCTEYRLGKADR